MERESLFSHFRASTDFMDLSIYSTETMSNDLKFLNAWNSVPGIGPATIRLLKNSFGALETAWLAGEAALAETGISPLLLQAISWKRPSLHPDREMEKLIRENIWMITETDENFPVCLKEIPSPPLFLYGRGDLRLLATGILLAVVGTRRPTAYGLEAAEAITRDLVATGITIVSGLASGIDAQAHQAALDEKGKTIAVLGSGLDYHSVFPAENRGLARRIAEASGVVVSEYSPGTPARKENFPQRNRIISGLSLGVLIVEARERSGALLTARLALEQNREVFAIPGSIFSSTSHGTNSLIGQGAKLVQSAADILEELGIEYAKEKEKTLRLGLEENERMIYQLLEEPLSLDTIKEKTGLATAIIVTSLSLLELKGAVRNLGQDTYQKVSNFQ